MAKRQTWKYQEKQEGKKRNNLKNFLLLCRKQNWEETTGKIELFLKIIVACIKRLFFSKKYY